MINKDNEIIYIGKAKNLKNRVSQYFYREQEGKVKVMVEHVDHFDITLVHSNKEAFILEMNLIQTHYPRYNIMLMDDSHYPYIALKRNDGYLKISRNKNDKNYFYYGPFPSSNDAYKTINLLNNLYQTRKCKKIEKKACFYYELGQCMAPCINNIDITTSKNLYEKIKRFLDGDIIDASKLLLEKIDKASEEERYEDAKYYYDIYKAIKETTNKQSVEINSDKTNRDIIGFSSRDQYGCLAILTYRNGILLGKKAMTFPLFGELFVQLIELLEQYYQNNDNPSELAINIDNFDEDFSSLYPNIKIIHPKEGRLLEQIDLASMNAKNELDAHFMSARLEDDKLDLLVELGNLLHIKTPYRIELFDNSHLEGSNAVGAVVVFINGNQVKKMYRKYHLSNENAGDDYHSMKEVVSRRYKRIKDENLSYPDLLLVDGGLTQIHAALEGLNEIEVNIPVFGLYKNDKHQTEGIIDTDGNIYKINNTSSLFFLLMRMQDEVHRFAISFHRSLRSKNLNKSIFDDVKGIGNKRKETLRKHYLTLDSLQKATLEELKQFLPSDVASEFYNKIQGNKEDDRNSKSYGDIHRGSSPLSGTIDISTS